MRRIVVLLVLLLLTVLQVTAYAADHWGGAPTGPTPAPAAVVVAMVTVFSMIGVLAVLLTLLFPGTNPVCAGFVAAGSVAGMYLIVDYVFILPPLQTWAAIPAQAFLLAALKSTILIFMVVWGVRCCLNKSARLREALIMAIVPVLVSVVLHWAAHALGIIK